MCKARNFAFPLLLLAGWILAAPIASAREPRVRLRQEPAGLTGLFPGEGQPGEELVLTLEGFGFLQSGEFLGVAIGGLEVPVLDFIFESDDFGQVRIFIPEDAPVGEQPITFFFEGAELEAPFFVLEPAVPGGPEPPDGPICSPTCIIIVIVVCVLLVGGVLRAVRKPLDSDPGKGEPDIGEPDMDAPDDDEPPIVPESINFIPETDYGTQAIEPAGRPITLDVDVEVESQLEHTDLRIKPDDPIVDETGITLEEGDGR